MRVRHLFRIGEVIRGICILSDPLYDPNKPILITYAKYRVKFAACAHDDVCSHRFIADRVRREADAEKDGYCPDCLRKATSTANFAQPKKRQAGPRGAAVPPLYLELMAAQAVMAAAARRMRLRI